MNSLIKPENREKVIANLRGYQELPDYEYIMGMTVHEGAFSPHG
jgi:hypothetical protein